MAWTLKTRLVGSFALAAVIALVVAAVGYWQVERLASALYEIGVVRLPSLTGLAEIADALSAVHAAERTLLLPGLDDGDFTRHRRNPEQSFAQLDRGLARYQPLPQTLEEAEAWRTFTPALSSWRSEHMAVIALIEQARKGDESLVSEARTRSLGAAEAAFRSAQAGLATSSKSIMQSPPRWARGRWTAGSAGRPSSGSCCGLPSSPCSAPSCWASSSGADSACRSRTCRRRCPGSLEAIATRGSRFARATRPAAWEKGLTSCPALQATERAQKQSTSDLLALNERYGKQRSALAALMRRSVEQPDDLISALQEITEIVADAVDGQRVSIYRFAEQRSILLCDDLFERATARHSPGLIITREEGPEVFTDPVDATIAEMASPPRESPKRDPFSHSWQRSASARTCAPKSVLTECRSVRSSALT